MLTIKSIFFDVDGVLLDSLPQHLAICHDQAVAQGVPVKIPDAAAFRQMVMGGIKISPMAEFFRAVGFPDCAVAPAVDVYVKHFASRYRPKIFAGTKFLLQTLRDRGFQLGLVTANVRQNIIPMLGPVLDFFPAEAQFYFGETDHVLSKADMLRMGASRFGVEPEDCLYIGDQPADADAARDAGFAFLGVSYGWGFSGPAKDFPVVASVTEILPMITEMKWPVAA